MIIIFRRGWQVLQSDSRLWIIVILLVLFPTLFILYSRAEIKFVEANLNTVLRQKISAVHDSIEAIVTSGTDIDGALKLLATKQKDITQLQLVTEKDGVMIVTHDAFDKMTGQAVNSTESFITSRIDPGTSYIFTYQISGAYREQAFRNLVLTDRTQLYIFTEHNFSPYYDLFAARATRPQWLLLAILATLTILPYWVSRQRNFEILYKKKIEELHERDAFSNSLVHELRTPLTAMRGYASLINESTTASAIERGYASRIMESTGRLITLVNDFLEASRIQSGKLPLTICDFDLSSLLDRVKSTVLPLATKKGLVVKNEWPDEPIKLYSDEKRIEQILINLMSNAIKYTDKGTITLKVEGNQKRIDVTIADTGAGISAPDQSKLFSPFVRVGSADQNSKVTGSGLGMWITKQLVEQLGGTITLESIQGVGTHVKLSIPKFHHSTTNKA